MIEQQPKRRTGRSPYFRLPKDKEGWVNASEYLPKDFDLCWIKTDEKKIKTGWLAGSSWDGLAVTENDKVVSWKNKKNIGE